MTLTVHHLRRSQSERIVWLCEELRAVDPEFTYELVLHDRNPITALAPASLKELSAARTAPVMIDSFMESPVTLAESQAIMEYIIHVHGRGKFSVPPDSPAYAHYLSWYNFANGSLQPGLTRLGTINLILKAVAQVQNGNKEQPLDGNEEVQRVEASTGSTADSLTASIRDRLYNHLDMLNDRLSQSKYLASEDLSAADIMTVFSLSTMRGFYPYSLEAYSNILRYLSDIAQRPAYRQAFKKAEPGMECLMTANVEPFDFAVFK